MPRKSRDIGRLLKNKFRFAEYTTDHTWYELTLPDCQTIKTKLSLGTREYGKLLEGKVARQLRVRKPFYEKMMSCTASCEDYYEQVSTDPYPPWDVLRFS